MKRSIRIATLGTLLFSLSGCAAWTSNQRQEASIANTLGNLDSSSQIGDTPTAKPNAKQAQVELLLALAEQDERRNDYQAATKKYQDVQKLETNLTASHRLALAWAHLGDHTQADKAMSECLKLAPDNVDILADASYLQYLQNRLDEAEKLSRRGLSLDPNMRRLHNNLGLILARRDVPSAAIQEFQLAGCSQTQALANVGHVYLLAGQVEKAHPYLQQAATGPAADPLAVKTQTMIASRGTGATSFNYSTK